MANYFYLILDTTPPRIKVAPTIIKTLGPTEIRITSNKDMVDYQDIYVIDSAGVRYDAVFSYHPLELTKIIDFTNFPLGISRIYVTVKDDMDNVTETVREIFIGTFSVTISVEEPLLELSYEASQPDLVIEIIPIGMEVER